MAVVLPVLVLLVVGIVESTNLICLKQSITISACEGVRVAIRNSASTGDVTSHVNRRSESLSAKRDGRAPAELPCGQTVDRRICLT